MTAQSKPAPSAPRLIETSPASQPDLAPSGFEHRFATVGGVRLHYVTGGKTDGEVIVLLAGFPESWFAWRKIMPLLAPSYRIIAPDLPGQGDSDRPQGGYDTQTLAAAVHGLLQQLGVDRCCMAAHDVGAWVAYPYAVLFGSEVRRLVLMDAGIPGITLPDALPTDPERAWRTWHFAFHALPDLPELLIGGREREYLDWFLHRKTANPEAFSGADIGEYLRVFTKTGGLIAIDKVGNQVLFLDPDSYETMLILDGFAPRVHELLVAPDQDIAYVPIYGDGIHGKNPHPGHLVALFDLKARRHMGDFSTYPHLAPHGLRWGPQGQLYCVCENSGVVLEMDAKTGAIGHVIEVGLSIGIQCWLICGLGAGRCHAAWIRRALSGSSFARP